MVCDAAKLCDGFAWLFEIQIRLPPDIRRPELGSRNVIVRPDCFQQLDGTRRLAAPGSPYRGCYRHLQTRGQCGRWKSVGKLARQTDCLFRAAQGECAAGALHGEVVARELQCTSTLAYGIPTRSSNGHRFGVLRRPLRGEVTRAIAECFFSCALIQLVSGTKATRSRCGACLPG